MRAPCHPERRGHGRNIRLGFSLPELLTAVTVLGVLAAIAMPMVGNSLHASRAADARASLLRTYETAIREATIRSQHVVACPVAADAGCADTIDWSGGWILFEDRDGDRERNESERVLSRFPALAAGVHLRGTTGRTRLVFQASGGNAGSNVTFTLCDGRGPERATQLILSNLGRLREARPPSDAAANCMASTLP